MSKSDPLGLDALDFLQVGIVRIDPGRLHFDRCSRENCVGCGILREYNLDTRRASPAANATARNRDANICVARVFMLWGQRATLEVGTA